jgi:hypothetical protein
MVAKLTVILFVLVCLMVGSLLILLPWTNLGIPGDWTDNFFLIWVIDKTGWEAIKTVVSSGWFRGAITGLGVFNLCLAFWEIATFSESVNLLEGNNAQTEK